MVSYELFPLEMCDQLAKTYLGQLGPHLNCFFREVMYI